MVSSVVIHIQVRGRCTLRTPVLENRKKRIAGGFRQSHGKVLALIVWVYWTLPGVQK